MNVSKCNGLTDATISPLAVGCAGLTSLDASGCNKLTDAAITALDVGCPRLTYVSLNFCNGLTDASIAALAVGCPGLIAGILCLLGEGVCQDSSWSEHSIFSVMCN